MSHVIFDAAEEGGLGFPLIAPKVSSSLFATESESGFGDRFYFSSLMRPKQEIFHLPFGVPDVFGGSVGGTHLCHPTASTVGAFGFRCALGGFGKPFDLKEVNPKEGR